MAAALRYAARKLGGRALQRRPASVVVEEPRFIPGRSRSTSSSAASNHTEGPSTHEESTLMAQVQEEKEALYHLIAGSSDVVKLRRPYSELLQVLSVEIKPKPDDPDWRNYRRAKRINEFVKCAATVAFLYVVASSLVVGLSKGPYSVGEKGSTQGH